MEASSQKGQSIVELMLVASALLACLIVEAPRLIKAYDEAIRDVSLAKDQR